MGRVSVVPLGGLGEIGLNALALCSGDDVVLVDCGLMFPQEAHPGVEYLIPDLTWLRQRWHRLRAVWLTHGHEDHIGAVPHLLAERRVPVYGTRFTVGLLAERVGRVAPSAVDCLRAVAPGEVVEGGAFRATFIPVTHSVPGACALAVETPAGVVLHTGDFKLDPTPVDGRLTDWDALGRWGDRGVDLLCCDATGAEREGSTPSERVVGDALRRLLPGVGGRAYVATFSSHVHRIQQVLEASRAVGRRVAFLGRSVVRSVRLARSQGLLRPAAGDIVPETRTRGMPREAVTLVLGGSQAEPGSALWRVSHGLEPHHRLRPGDHLFLCAKRIPGHDRAVYRLIDRCVRQGVRVFHEDVAEVHASGHASADDLLRLLERLRPTHVLPVHGELRHLEACAGLARQAGVPAERVFRLENGQTVQMERGRVWAGEPVSAGRVYVERGGAGAPGDGMLRDRRRMGRDGLAVAVARIGPDGGLAWGPRVELRGVVPPAVAARATAEAEAALLRAVAAADPRPDGADAWAVVLEAALVRHFRREGRRPVVVAALAAG